MKVVVIGGGILGASIAWHLRDKADLTVIDCGALVAWPAVLLLDG